MNGILGKSPKIVKAELTRDFLENGVICAIWWHFFTQKEDYVHPLISPLSLSAHIAGFRNEFVACSSWEHLLFVPVANRPWFQHVLFIFEHTLN